MEISSIHILPILASAGLLLFMYVVKRLNDRMTEIENRLREQANKIEKINIELPSNYVNKIEFGKIVESLFLRIDAMDTKIDAKIDRIYDKVDSLFTHMSSSNTNQSKD